MMTYLHRVVNEYFSRNKLTTQCGQVVYSNGRCNALSIYDYLVTITKTLIPISHF